MSKILEASTAGYGLRSSTKKRRPYASDLFDNISYENDRHMFAWYN